MSAVKSRNWNAWIDTMPGSPSKLIVTGEVETSASNKLPQLGEAVPQGINPAILILDLSIRDIGGIGTQNFAYRDARFTKPAAKGQYTQVEIRSGTATVAMINVGTTS